MKHVSVPKPTIEALLRFEIDPAFARRANIQMRAVFKGKHNRILEVGCGRGFYVHALSALFPTSQITGVDIQPTYIAKARQFAKGNHVHLVTASAYTLPFASHSFDVVLCTEVLEHLFDDVKAIQELYRVLAPGGKAIISVPVQHYPFFWDPINFILEHTLHIHIPSTIWWLAGIWADHLRLYTEETMDRQLQQAGFSIEKRYRCTSFCLPFSHFFLYGIGKNLVESGLFGKNWDRFSSQKQPSGMLLFVQKIFALWDRRNGVSAGKRKRYLNYIAIVKK